MLLAREWTGDRARAHDQINAALNLAREIGMQGVVENANALLS